MSHDAVVVGSGPNGLSAALVLARAGLSVLVVESKPTLGGGVRSAELTLPGFLHDVCSAIHPTALLSPFFSEINLQDEVDWIEPPAALAHPFSDGTAALLYRSVEETARNLGNDESAWRSLMEPFVERGRDLITGILRPMFPPHNLLTMARFGMIALRSCLGLVQSRFQEDRAQALFGGCAAHSLVPLDQAGTASFGLVLTLAGHLVGWPLVRGGSQRITDALEKKFRAAGGEIRLDTHVTSLRELPAARVILFDVTPRQLAAIARDDLPARYLTRMERFRYGPGVFKIDWALDGPIPWRAPECAQAATVHVGGSIAEIAAAEDGVWHGHHAESPFVLVAQQSLFDPSRAPAGKHTGWAYCHVPNGSRVNMTDAIERQVERFAPGFRDRILARSTISAAQYEQHNANMIGGDISGGANDLPQILARPVFLNPYATPNHKIFLCSSSTPPGGGVHGMCGYWAAHSALRRLFGKGQNHAA